MRLSARGHNLTAHSCPSVARPSSLTRAVLGSRVLLAAVFVVTPVGGRPHTLTERDMEATCAEPRLAPLGNSFIYFGEQRVQKRSHSYAGYVPHHLQSAPELGCPTTCSQSQSAPAQRVHVDLGASLKVCAFARNKRCRNVVCPFLHIPGARRRRTRGAAKSAAATPEA